MKSVTFDEARTKFETLFELAAGGETVIIARKGQRVAIHPFPAVTEDPEIAPPGYFESDYDFSEISDLNTLASQGPKSPLP